MTTDEFKACIVTYYQTEVLGEALFESLITKFQEPDHRYKIGSLLQLETETKARLRPTLLELGGLGRGSGRVATHRARTCRLDKRRKLAGIRCGIERGGRTTLTTPA